MAINTYGTLQTAVANWLDRDDLTSRIPEFISLTEAIFNRTLRIRAMETIVSDNTPSGSKEDALPTGYLQMREIHLETSPIVPLSYITPEIMYRIRAGSVNGRPNSYTIMGENILFGPTPDSVYAYSMTYYKALDALADNAPTNWAILNAPDMYLYGTLLQAEPFLMNDERVPLWERGFRQAISDLQEQDNKDRHSGSEMRVMNTSGYY
jgi:hypothetical protein|tara:strand:+ start:2137 stop:2763 length:627 start_codon:yes stop_codon:yes gene_type:complete